MKTLALLSQKGGTSKTTLALNLAVTAEHAGETTAVIDLDPQASAKGWHDHRKKEVPIVVSAQSARLRDVLDTARDHGASLVIIDTAPHSESASLAAARAADLVMTPCRPGILDLRAISSSIDICSLAKAEAVAVLNAVPPRGTLVEEAIEAISGYGLAIAPVQVGQRIAFVHSLTAGQTAIEYEPQGRASQEIKLLYMWICKHVNMSTPTWEETYA